MEFGVADIELAVGIDFEESGIVVRPELADIESVGIEVAETVFEVVDTEIDLKAAEIG